MGDLVVLAIYTAAALLLVMLPAEEAAPGGRPIIDPAPWIFF